jgi:hypothetical protein
MRGRFSRAVLLGGLIFANAAYANVIQFSGLITQSTADGTGPAVNNPFLNLILTGDPYTVTLAFTGSITPSAVPYDFTGASLVFADPAQAVTESSFDVISLTLSADGVFDDISLLACLTTGSACAGGNQLTANFQIPAAMLNSQNVTATGLDEPHPLDLLEDDGVTDIHGSIDRFSQTGGASAVPEPAPLPLLTFLSSAAALIKRTHGRRHRAADDEEI